MLSLQQYTSSDSDDDDDVKTRDNISLNHRSGGTDIDDNCAKATPSVKNVNSQNVNKGHSEHVHVNFSVGPATSSAATAEDKSSHHNIDISTDKCDGIGFIEGCDTSNKHVKNSNIDGATNRNSSISNTSTSSGNLIEIRQLTSHSAYGNSSDSHCDIDYFGLSESDDSGDDDEVAHVPSPRQSEDKNIHSVDIPRSSFWRDITYDSVRVNEQIHSDTAALSNHRDQQKYHKHSRKRTTPEENEASPKGYISKRKKIEQTQHHEYNHTETPDTDSCQMKKSFFYIHHSVAPHLHSKVINKTPRKEIVNIRAHPGTVNRINWCKGDYSHLLLSCSMDRSVKIWNVFSSENQCVQTFTNHHKAVKDACWSSSGKQVLSCGYDRMARITDVETGLEIQNFEHDSFVTCVQFHPVNYNVFVTGANNCLSAWDLRTPSKPIKRYIYKDSFGQVEDVCFTTDGDTLFSCNDMVARDSSDKSIMAWHFDRTVVLSNQIFQERYTCTRLKAHPFEKKFVAQTNGDYIAEFSTERPYKMNKCKRFEGHKVSGYSVGCDFSADGSLLVSGSVDGNLCFYDCKYAKLFKKFSIGQNRVCLDVAWHPVLFSTVAASSWDGGVSIWQ